ncbi:MAG TPA: ATP-binding protein [Eggerthellaceae bacterium]|nr:ATP-binding protein [Eggerthellaceae bacterium]
MIVEVAGSVWQRLRGLIGREGFEGELLLVPCNDVHTFGMRAPLDIAFVDGLGYVIAVHRDVGPCRRVRKRGARATVERFASAGAWYELGSRIRLQAPSKGAGVAHGEGFSGDEGKDGGS